jgi:Tripartite tricarboxylate transporter TctB family
MTDETEAAEPRASRPALGADLIIPVLAVAFAIYFLVDTAGLVWEARANGTVIGGILIVLATAQILRIAAAVRAGRATLGLGELAERSPAQLQRLGLVVTLVVFIATIPWLGTTLGMFAVMLVSMWLLGVRRPGLLIGVAFAVAAVVYLLFMALLQSRLPRGIVENLLSSLFMGGG